MNRTQPVNIQRTTFQQALRRQATLGRLQRALVALTVGWACLQGASAHAGDVAVDPAVIVFQTKDEAHEVAISHEDTPLRADQIFDHELYVNAHTYAEFLSVTPREGGVTVRPTARLEIGSYTLDIDTRYGVARIQVYSPLTLMPDSLESRAAQQGISVDELKERMGLTQQVARGAISLNVPPVYYQGQILNIPLNQEPGRMYQWSVNGEPVGPRKPEASFSKILEDTGSLLIELSETNAEGVVTASASALVEVVQPPPMLVETIPNRSFMLRAAPDYRHHTWTLDGQPAGTGETWTHTFRSTGTFEVVCISRQPLSGVLGQFYPQRYTITVVDP